MVFPSRAKFAQDKPDRFAVSRVVESGVAVAESLYGRSTELLEFFDGAAQMEMINEPLLGRIAQSTPPCVKSKRPGLPGTDCPPQTMRRVGRILGLSAYPKNPCGTGFQPVKRTGYKPVPHFFG